MADDSVAEDGVDEDGVDEFARQAWAQRDWARAAALYEQLATSTPDHASVGDWWYDAALAYKFLRNWPEAYRLGRHAVAFAPRGNHDPAFWNLGVAATIQRDWVTARDAWDGFGLTMPAGDGPIDGNFGRACVRLSPDDDAEVVWVQRLCPTRARIVNVPFDLSRRFGEVVVHDGEPKGNRVVGDRTYPVFDELVLFEPSTLPTLAVTVTVTATAAGSAELDALAELLGSWDYGFEPLANGQALCTCCSEGSVEQEQLSFSGTQKCLIAAPLEQARVILEHWGGSWSDLHAAV